MRKAKVLIGLITLLLTFSATTVPANAWFQSGTKGGTGQATKGAITPPNLVIFTTSSEGAKSAITCESTSSTKATGFWTIQTSEETITELGGGSTEQKQPATKLGPHEAVTIQKWGTCKAIIAGSTFAADVNECRIQFAQPSKGTGANQSGAGSIQTNCVIKTPATNCTIIFPQTKANHDFGAIRLTNSEAGVELKANVTGLFYKASAGCVALSGEHVGGTFSTGVEGGEGIIATQQTLV